MIREYRVRLKVHSTGSFYDIEAEAGTKKLAGRIAKAKLQDRIGEIEASKYAVTRVTFIRQR